MTSNRRGQAQSALRAVQGRHEAIQKIERQMIELAQLFQDMEAAVVQQEEPVANIDTKAEDTVVNIGKGNEQLDQAVVKARSARKKKWICLGLFSKLEHAYVPFCWVQADQSNSCHYWCHCCGHCHCCCGHKQQQKTLSGLQFAVTQPYSSIQRSSTLHVTSKFFPICILVPSLIPNQKSTAPYLVFSFVWA